MLQKNPAQNKNKKQTTTSKNKNYVKTCVSITNDLLKKCFAKSFPEKSYHFIKNFKIVTQNMFILTVIPLNKYTFRVSHLNLHFFRNKEKESILKLVFHLMMNYSNH